MMATNTNDQGASATRLAKSQLEYRRRTDELRKIWEAGLSNGMIGFDAAPAFPVAMAWITERLNRMADDARCQREGK